VGKNKISELESLISEQFNHLADEFPENILSRDVRVKTILEFFGDIQGKKVLDIGCGKGRFLKILKEQGAIVWGIDTSRKLLEIAKKISGAKLSVASATNLPFNDETFDYLLCIEVLQHIPDTKEAIAEMARVVKKDGYIIIIDRNILALDTQRLIPVMLLKKYHELRGNWMYPKEFPFREKWFVPRKINRMMKGYFKIAEYEYLDDICKEVKIFRLFPGISPFVAWKGIK